MKLLPYFSDWRQVAFGGLLDGISAAAVSDVLTPPTGERFFPQTVRVLAVLDGDITSEDLTLSLGAKDLNAVEAWSLPQVADIRTLPDDDETKVVSILRFHSLHSAAIRLALESAIAGGGTAKFYVSFEGEQ